MKKVADKEEYLLVLDENGKSTGKLELRSVVHEKGLFHNEVALWILDTKTSSVLVQRRSPNKKKNPNKLGCCAGHVVAFDTIEDTLEKELNEEYGLNIKDYEVHSLCTIKICESNNNHYSHQFYIISSIPTGKIKIQEEELSEVFYIDYEILKDLIETGSDEVVFKYENYKQVLNEFDKIFNLKNS